MTAWAEEWEKITGASATSRASCMVAGDVCDRSTSMPSQFISRITSSPNRVRPPCNASPVPESAQSIVVPWVSVM